MKRATVTEELAYGTALDRLTGTDQPSPAPKKEKLTDPSKSKVAMIKLSVFLHREEDAYLETLASTAKFSGGNKISKTRLIETMVRAFRNTKLDVRGVKTDEELFKRVTAQLR
ncbi:hypothetical protein ACFLTK_03630 [Chloroflexota bacterium]